MSLGLVATGVKIAKSSKYSPECRYCNLFSQTFQLKTREKRTRRKRRGFEPSKLH